MTLLLHNYKISLKTKKRSMKLKLLQNKANRPAKRIIYYPWVKKIPINTRGKAPIPEYPPAAPKDPEVHNQDSADDIHVNEKYHYSALRPVLPATLGGET